jgi:3-hydroxyisobutyrate dehydrogenase-like beta-hydroxyacid dehydrogenase
MGLNIAKNLQKHLAATRDLGLCFTNRTMSRSAVLEELGAVPYNTIAEVVKRSDIIFPQ